EIGGLLPVFVLDRYEGLEARRLPDLTQAERERYVELNAAALRRHLPADLVFANHVLLGGPVAAASGARYAVKAHGSELEYAMRGNEELSAWGRESLAAAEAVFVGSEHIREVLEDVVGHVERVHVLLDALRETDARAVIVGFGDYRPELERIAPERTLFTGALEHRHLAKLVPLADVTAVPSIFPEAFGMVAAEAASAGSLPLV